MLFALIKISIIFSFSLFFSFQVFLCYTMLIFPKSLWITFYPYPYPLSSWSWETILLRIYLKTQIKIIASFCLFWLCLINSKISICLNLLFYKIHYFSVTESFRVIVYGISVHESWEREGPVQGYNSIMNDEESRTVWVGNFDSERVTQDLLYELFIQVRCTVQQLYGQGSRSSLRLCDNPLGQACNLRGWYGSKGS